MNFKKVLSPHKLRGTCKKCGNLVWWNNKLRCIRCNVKENIDKITNGHCHNCLYPNNSLKDGLCLPCWLFRSKEDITIK